MTKQPKYVTIDLPNNSNPSLVHLVELRNELQEQLDGVTCAITNKVVNDHPEFLKIDWDKLGRMHNRNR